MHEYAITVIGHDRPGIIADAAGILAELGLNLTDSTMTLLRGHFAMTLVCVGAPEAAAIEVGLAPLTSDGSLLVTVRELDTDLQTDITGGHYVLSLHGADRLGIVAAVSRLIADVGGNVTDLSTRLAGDLYVLVAELDLPSEVDVGALTDRLGEVASALAVEASLRRADVDLL